MIRRWVERIRRGNFRARLADAWDARAKRIRLTRSGFHWSRRPGSLAGKDVCFLATFVQAGRPSEHLRILATAWHAAGFEVIVVASTDAYDPSRVDLALPPSVAGVILRENCGYDFGSWSIALRHATGVRDARLVALANDSVYGPLGDLAPLIERVRQCPADIVGMTDSFERCHHMQSYLVFYKAAALRSPTFWRFWNTRKADGRARVISECELELMNRFRGIGAGVQVLFPVAAGSKLNPTLSDWQRLVEAGFPFVKIMLLRDNPYRIDLAGWAAFMAARGYDPGIVRNHIGTDPTGSPAS